MKKLLILALLFVSMSSFAQNQIKTDRVIANTIENLSEYQCTVDTIAVDNHVVTRMVINNYCYHNIEGTLMLMYTENRLFGIKYRSDGGVELCWTYLENIVGRSGDLWGEFAFN